jgi:hypothetical protein
VQNRAQAEFQADVRVNEFFFAMDQQEQVDQPEKATADEDNESRPNERAGGQAV